MTEFLGSTKLDANGNGSIFMQNNIAGVTWTVQQVAVWTAQIAPAGTVSLWKNGFLAAPSGALSILQTATGSVAKGSGTSAAGLPYIDLAAGDVLEVRLQSCTALDQAYANFMYTESYVGASSPSAGFSTGPG